MKKCKGERNYSGLFLWLLPFRFLWLVLRLRPIKWRYGMVFSAVPPKWLFVITANYPSPDISWITCCDHGYGRPSWRPRVSAPATYRSGTPRNQHPAVARWHAHLRGLATAIHEISGLAWVLGQLHITCQGRGHGAGSETGGSEQKTEVGGQKSEIGGQREIQLAAGSIKTEVGGQKSEIGGQTTEDTYEKWSKEKLIHSRKIEFLTSQDDRKPCWLCESPPSLNLWSLHSQSGDRINMTVRAVFFPFTYMSLFFLRGKWLGSHWV